LVFLDFSIPCWVLVAITLFMSWLLVSEVPMFSLKFKGFGFAQNKLRYLFLLFVAVTVSLFGVGAVAFVLIAYILVSIIRNLVLKK
ncbi:MAG: phosphatidylserine synthase, partial [Rikenellaceae bacterium]|nr:phosphatidylserine synthase [Rikenellaceae bacterium]